MMFVHTLLLDPQFTIASIGTFSFGRIGRMRGKLLYTQWHNEHMGSAHEKNFTTHFIYIRVGRYLFDSSTTAGNNSTVVYEVHLE